jgi:hypothetical protein
MAGGLPEAPRAASCVLRALLFCTSLLPNLILRPPTFSPLTLSLTSPSLTSLLPRPSVLPLEFPLIPFHRGRLRMCFSHSLLVYCRALVHCLSLRCRLPPHCYRALQLRAVLRTAARDHLAVPRYIWRATHCFCWSFRSLSA